jgi:hypothetical protein
MKPPMVVPVTRPSAHKMSSITAIVYNIKFLFGWLAGWRALVPAGDQLMV